MNVEFLFVGLAAISVFTTLTVEAIKKILDDAGKSYSANILAAVVAVVLSIASSIGYIIVKEIPLTNAIIVEIIAMAFLSFLCSTVGFDKIKQTIIQLVGSSKTN